MGFVMGWAVGMVVGVLFGIFSLLRVRIWGQELMDSIRKTMMQCDGTFRHFGYQDGHTMLIRAMLPTLSTLSHQSQSMYYNKTSLGFKPLLGSQPCCGWRDLHNSVKIWAMLGRVTKDEEVIMKSSDKARATGGGNGKPVQYSFCDNAMNSLQR